MDSGVMWYTPGGANKNNIRPNCLSLPSQQNIDLGEKLQLDGLNYLNVQLEVNEN